MSSTSAQLENAALTVPCTTHQVPAGAECPGGGACMDRYGISPGQWAGWFERGLADRQHRPGRQQGQEQKLKAVAQERAAKSDRWRELYSEFIDPG